LTSRPPVRPLARRRFDALAGYTRQPIVIQLTQEIDWLATPDERVLGVVTWGRIDHDFGWVALGRDERLRFRAIAANASLQSADAARTALVAAMEEWTAGQDNTFQKAT
jgi:hypothetical protein